MVDVNKNRFAERLNYIQRKADPRVRVERRVSDDGLVVDVLKPAKRKRSILPMKSFVTIVLVFLIFKGFVFAQVGEDEYLGRVAQMQSGNTVERSLSFFFEADPATRVMAKGLDAVFRGRY